MKVELCGKVATYLIDYDGNRDINLCTVHFSNGDIQHMVMRKLVGFRRLEERDAICQAEVQKREGPGDSPRAFKRVVSG